MELKKIYINLRKLYIINIFLDHLSLNETAVDYAPRNEAFWFRGPIEPDVRMVGKREGCERMKAKSKGLSQHQLDQEKIHEPYDRAVQVQLSPAFFPKDPLKTLIKIMVCVIAP